MAVNIHNILAVYENELSFLNPMKYTSLESYIQIGKIYTPVRETTNLRNAQKRVKCNNQCISLYL